MKQKEIQPNESLAIISRMIDTAKNKLADDGFLLIFWGWLVFVAAIIHYATIVFGVSQGYLAWVILMPLGGVVSVVYGFRQKQKERMRSHLDVYLGYSWGAFMIALFITLALMPVHGWTTTYFFFMVLYGVATFISGGLLSFRPLIIGSLFSFVFAVVSVFVTEPNQLLCLAAAILCSYVIPGHLLRAKFRSQNNV